ncbi:MAG: hypothetical protein JXA71_01440 [Chitinispirillaceae bacterium]|nr:hypothetical protein [Chitinispirillaceae bacterium]
MPFDFRKGLVLLAVAIGTLYAGDGDTISTDVRIAADSLLMHTDTALAAEGMAAVEGIDTLPSAVQLPVPAADRKSEKLELIKRSYNGRQQVLLAAGMMVFVVGIMTLAQQWNPR